MYYQNGCLYVVPAGVPDPCAANSSNQTFNQQPLNYSNSNYYYCSYLQGQTGNYNYVYNYQPGQQPQPQQQQFGGCSTSSAGGSGLTRKRISSLVALIALKVAVGAVTGAIF